MPEDQDQDLGREARDREGQDGDTLGTGREGSVMGRSAGEVGRAYGRPGGLLHLPSGLYIQYCTLYGVMAMMKFWVLKERQVL